MPELPEVETTVRGLARFLDGARIARVALHREGLRRPFPPGLVQALTGARITGLSRQAKYGLIATDRGMTMVFHLGMSGRWRIDPEALGKHDHLVIETASGHVLALNDARRFGSIDLIETAALAAWPAFAALGPEPLGPALTSGYLAAAFTGRHTAVKPLLLDQRIVAGLGNIYVCEALHAARISPLREAGKVSRAVWRDWSLRSVRCWRPRSRRAARPSATMPSQTANWAILRRHGESMAARATPAPVAER